MTAVMKKKQYFLFLFDSLAQNWPRFHVVLDIKLLIFSLKFPLSYLKTN